MHFQDEAPPSLEKGEGFHPRHGGREEGAPGMFVKQDTATLHIRAAATSRPLSPVLSHPLSPTRLETHG